MVDHHGWPKFACESRRAPNEETVHDTASTRQSSDDPAIQRRLRPAGATDDRPHHRCAREVFLTRGYAGTTVDEIARIADVSRASFYAYFPSKREVLLALGAPSKS
jgi:hypothetical protein